MRMKIIALFTIFIMIIGTVHCVFAEDSKIQLDVECHTEEEQSIDELNDIPYPYTLYILNVHSSIKQQDNNDILVVGSAYCTETMAKIEIRLEFQQRTPDGWLTLATATDSAEDVTHYTVAATVTGAPSGTYRTKAIATVRSYSGYAEFLESFTNGYTHMA